MEAESEVRALRGKVRRLERLVVGGAVLLVSAVALGARPAGSDAVEACRFVLRDPENRVVATLGCEGELHLPRLRFYNSLNSRLLMDVGTEGLFGGYPVIRVLDNCGVGGVGGSVVIENEGDPGRPVIRFSSPPGLGGARAQMEFYLDRGGEGVLSQHDARGDEVWRVAKAPKK